MDAIDAAREWLGNQQAGDKSLTHVSFANYFIDAFIAGAAWQLKQDNLLQKEFLDGLREKREGK